MVTKRTPAKKAAVKRPARNSPVRKAAAKRTPSAAGNSPDAVAFLMKDHRDAKRLFKRFETLEKNSEKESVALTVCKMLTVHTTIEEEIFYPACRKAGLERDEMDEADIEHASAKDLIAQIESMDAGESHYDAKVKVLGEYIDHHVKEEETSMFKKARRLKLDLNEIGRQLKLRAEDLKSENGLTPDRGLFAKATDKFVELVGIGT